MDEHGRIVGALIPISLTTDKSLYAPGEVVNIAVNVALRDLPFQHRVNSHNIDLATPIHLEVYKTFIRGTGNPGNLHVYGAWVTARNFFDPPLSGPQRHDFSAPGTWNLALTLQNDNGIHGYKLIFIASNRAAGIDRHIIGTINIDGANPLVSPASNTLKARREDFGRSVKRKRDKRLK